MVPGIGRLSYNLNIPFTSQSHADAGKCLLLPFMEKANAADV